MGLFLRVLLPFIFLTGLITLGVAQHEVVQFNYNTLSFDEGNPLPSGEDIVVKGTLPDVAEGVQIKLYSKKGEEKQDPIFTGFWKQPIGRREREFRIPLGKRLRGNSKYDFRISYYRKISEEERKEVRRKLIESLDTYVDQQFSASKRRVKLFKKANEMREDLDRVVRESLVLYNNQNDLRFKGFSDLVTDQLKKLDKAKLSSGLNIFGTKDKDATRVAAYNKMKNDLKAQIRSEVEYLFSNEWMKVYDSRYVNDYKTDKSGSALPLQIGYGVALMGGVADSLNYGHGPYVGITIPLGNEAFRSAFWSRTSINVGIFLRDFKGEEGDRISGPVVQRPVHLGLGYKLYRFVNLNAGVTLLERKETAGTISGAGDRMYIRPYVGLSARINLRMGLDD